MRAFAAQFPNDAISFRIIELNYLENPFVNKVIIDEKGNMTCAVSSNVFNI
jgi:hypothetical protein